MMRFKYMTTAGFYGLLALAGSATGKTAPVPDALAPLTAERAAVLSQNVNRPVIVIMKNQFGPASIAGDQAAVMSELHQVGATHIKAYHIVNAFAATVSEGEVARLNSNPAVARVVPDVMLHHAPLTHTAGAAAGSSLLKPNVIPGACGYDGKVQLDPEALQTTNTASDIASAKTARALGFTGAGVKVAWIADGVDPHNRNFLRKDGKSAFFDYRDFSGDGPGQLTGGDEAFLDSNAIGGQGLVVYNVRHFGAQPDPGQCNIRIEGMAPGAAILGMDVFGTYEYTVESNFLEAIDYAAFTDHVDVLNESFGSNPFPDTTSLDVTKQFNEAAVAAGVTVTVSSGDAGSTNTIGSPSTDPAVISVGASTTFRFYAQTNYAAARYFATTGWLDDNISSLSSGGYNETAGTVDIVAPGDLAFASCDESPVFYECTNFLGQSSDVEESGGTSLSSPLTAGAAALVIEAYRKTHGGASPAPALVKHILTSTASDLGVPAVEQGAGLLNTYKAVLLAESISTADGSPTPAGETLLLSQSQLNIVGAPNSAAIFPVVVTNAGTQAQTVHAEGRTFGPEQNIQSGSVTLSNSASPKFVNYAGVGNNYAVITFTVPAGADRLNASIAYPAPPGASENARVRLILIDPKGRFVAHSLPQGVGNYGNVDVRAPLAGTWTGVIFGDVAGKKIGGFNGVVPWQVSTQQFVPFAQVSPADFVVEPGKNRILSVGTAIPTTPGDTSGSIVLTTAAEGSDPYIGPEKTSIAVTVRSLVAFTNGVGTFNGVLTGGNGRPNGEGQVAYYAFTVPAGTKSITANVALSSDNGDPVGAYLIAPDGEALGFGEGIPSAAAGPVLSAYTLNPAAGSWTLVVDFAEPIVGDEVSQPFSGSLSLNATSASASGLPDSTSTVLPAGTPVTVPVSVACGAGGAPCSFFLDARLNATETVTLQQLAPPPTPSGYPLPLAGNTPQWFVPTQTSNVAVTASATLPIEFDYGAYQGDPDLFGAPTAGNNAAGAFAPSGGVVQPGYWYADPDEIGPYPSLAMTGYVNASMTATTKIFDPAVASPTGDLWQLSLGAISFNPISVLPGQSGTVNVTITPTGNPGTIVKGTLYVDTYVPAVPPYNVPEGNELVAIPYSYTVGAPAAASVAAERTR